ncbi:MAG: hypothetical protein K2L34_14655 [Muribaculaceae bacterium]|nr:hypothetical protein [Muribaculaceae bacterium]
MCQTALISDKIVRLGTRSFKQRLEVVAGNEYSVTKLSRLNRSLDDFYEFLYTQINSVTQEDYKIFGPQLSILLSTLKDLYKTCQSLPKSWGFATETDKLGRNYSALYEVENDLRTFKKCNSATPEMSKLLSKAGIALKQLAM